jgi:uncharacterized repeat protein (TIGR03803 family)
MNRFLFSLLLLVGCLCNRAMAQQSEPANDSDRVRFPGGMHPASDIGPTRQNLRVPRMLLVRARSVRQGHMVRAAGASNGEPFETVLHSFNGTDGEYPRAGLVMDSAGNLYGTTVFNVFKLDPAGNEMVLYNFPADTTPYGGNPQAALILDAGGSLYGTTNWGGPDGSWCGTVFKVDPNGNGTVLHNFTSANGDGQNPIGRLLMDSAGNLYGTTNYGPEGGLCDIVEPFGYGIVFKLDPVGNETVLLGFGGVGGANPAAGLTRDTAGNFYGTTVNGGTGSCQNVSSDGCGTVFKLDPSGNETVLHSFTNANGDGGHPTELVMDSVGNLYGTTETGGTGSCNLGGDVGCGTVFKIDPTEKESVLYSFTNANGDGVYPNSGLVMDSVGNLYGTTETGGTGSCPLDDTGCGTVFKVDPNGNESVLYSFTAVNGDGAGPSAGLIIDDLGNLYGTTAFGGLSNQGTVFKLLAPPDFGLKVSAASPDSLVAGQSGTSTITIASVSGFSGAVSLTCSAPVTITCSISPTTVTPGGSSTLTVTTTGASAELTWPMDRLHPTLLYASWAPFVAAFFMRLGSGHRKARRGKRSGFLLMCLLCGSVFFQPACGGNSPHGGNKVTPPGSYSITVRGQAGTMQRSSSVTVTVQ